MGDQSCATLVSMIDATDVTLWLRSIDELFVLRGAKREARRLKWSIYPKSTGRTVSASSLPPRT
jgi:hypothetical protein